MQGRLDGENAVKDGEGFMYQKLDEWRDDTTIQEEFPKVSDYVRHHVTESNKMHKQERRHQDADAQE
jgi:hypothetical protein